MTEKFTKEPWEISDMSCHDAMDNFTVCFHIGVSSTGEMIADCQSDNKADYERVRANAHLIKAAPEMYEMLDEVGSDLAMAFTSVPGIESEIWQEILKEDVEKICAILKKARGEA
jgi:hypothetical protein